MNMQTRRTVSVLAAATLLAGINMMPATAKPIASLSVTCAAGTANIVGAVPHGTAKVVYVDGVYSATSSVKPYYAVTNSNFATGTTVEVSSYTHNGTWNGYGIATCLIA